MKRYHRNILVSAVAALALYGCGGGAGNTAQQNNQTDLQTSTPTKTIPSATVITTTTLSTDIEGTAVKGILQSANVTAVELDVHGGEIANVGSAITNNKGQYKLTLNSQYKGGIVRLRVSAVSNTTMKCDAFEGCGSSTFGEIFALTPGFYMDALVSPQGKNIHVSITPLTHMAAAKALATGNLIKSTVDEANSSVSQIAGVDILNSDIPDVSDATSLAAATPEARKLALVNAGFAKLLVTGTGNTNENIAARLTELAKSFEDGTLGNSDDKINMRTISIDIQSALILVNSHAAIKNVLKNEIQDITTTLAAIQSKIDREGRYTPSPSTVNTKSNEEKAKALLTSARTLFETMGSNFKDPIEALGVDAEAIGKVLGKDTNLMASLLSSALQQVVNDLNARSIDFTQNKTYTTQIKNNADTHVGRITTRIETQSAKGGVALILNGSLNGERKVDITHLTLATNIPVSALTKESTLAGKGMIGKITTNNPLLKTTGYIGNTDTSLTLNDVSLTLNMSKDIVFNTVTRTENFGNGQLITAASLKGDMTIESHGASFNGKVTMTGVPLNSNRTIHTMSLKSMSVSGNFSGNKGAFDASASITIDNAATFDTFGYLNYSKSARRNFAMDSRILNQENVDKLMAEYEADHPERKVIRMNYIYAFRDTRNHHITATTTTTTTRSSDSATFSSQAGVTIELETKHTLPDYQTELVYFEPSSMGYGVKLFNVSDNALNTIFKNYTDQISLYNFDNTGNSVLLANLKDIDYSITHATFKNIITSLDFGDIILKATLDASGADTAFRNYKHVDFDGNGLQDSLQIEETSTTNIYNVTIRLISDPQHSVILPPPFSLPQESSIAAIHRFGLGDFWSVLYFEPVSQENLDNCKANSDLYFSPTQLIANLQNTTSTAGDASPCDSIFFKPDNNNTNLELFDFDKIKSAISEQSDGTKVKTFDYWSALYSYNHGSPTDKIDSRVTFDDFESADNFVKGSINVTSSLNIPGLDKIVARISANRTDFKGGNVSVNISGENTQSYTLNIESSDISVDKPTGTLTLSNADGVKLEIKLAVDTSLSDIRNNFEVVSGTLTVGGILEGTISKSPNGLIIIRYTSGNMETIY